MAIVQLHRAEFLQDNVTGTFFTGDILDIYLDTDLATGVPINFFADREGITVKLNGDDYTDGAFILYIDSAYVSVQSFSPQICIGTSLLQIDVFYGLFPYTSYRPLENHYSCEVNPPTCNLIVSGIPTIVPATSATDTDGAITVTATSTNTIQYKLNSDFTYNDGTAQNDGFFSGLLPGSYRVFLRDSANCGVNVLATVPIDNTYGPRFRLEYTDLKGNDTRLDIVKRGYTGEIIEVCGAGEAFQVSLRGEGSIDKFETLVASQATLALTSLTDLQFIEVYTNDPNLYRIMYYKYEGLDLKGVYKILPQQYAEEYKAPPYYVSIVASDGLPELTEYYLIQDDGQKYFGTISLIKLVAHCLRFLKLDLPIRVACNLYATTMDQEDSDDPFDQAYVDFEAFYLSGTEPTLDFVLRSILEIWGARITQWDGRWNIVRVEEMIGEYDYRDFDKDGEYVSNGSFSPVIDIDYPNNNGDLLLANRDHNLEIRPGYGMIKVVYNLGLKPNILRNGDFRLTPVFNSALNTYFQVLNKDGWTLVNGGYPVEETYEQLEEDNIAYKIIGRGAISGEAYVQSDTYNIILGTNNQLKISLRCKVTDPTFGLQIPDLTNVSTIYSPNVPYFKVRIVVEYGGLYLKADGFWSTSLNELVYHYPLSDLNKYIQIEFNANPPRSDTVKSGNDFKIKVYHAYVYHTQFKSLSSLKAFKTRESGTHVIPTGFKTELSSSDGALQGIFWYVLEESEATPDDYDIVRPADYESSVNTRQWIRQKQYPNNVTTSIPGISPPIQMVNGMCIDKIVVQFLTDGKDPIDAIIRSVKAESQNKHILEKEIFFGSYSNLIVTERHDNFGFIASITLANYLSFDLLYTCYLRDSEGTGYENFTRDGVAESDKLHGILLKSYALQYRKSWRLLRGSIYANAPFGLLNVVRNVNDSNRIYLPMGLTHDDKRCMWSGEFLELIDITGNSGSDGSGSAPFNSAFSSGFGSSGFN